jgi:hypothetical protein
MDDTARMTREFQIGEGDNAITVTASQPTTDQLFVLAMSRTTGNPQSHHRIIQRLLRILEALTGPEVWYSKIEDGLIDGRITTADLMKFADSVLFHAWDETEPAPEPADVPGDGA